MGIDETLFGWLWSRVRPSSSPRPTTRDTLLEGNERRLSMLASMLSERSVSVVSSATWSERFIVVPESFPLAMDLASCETLLRVRVAWEAEVRRRGLVISRDASPMERRVGAALIATEVERSLVERCHGILPDLLRCRAWLLADRPSIHERTKMDAALEAFFQMGLGLDGAGALLRGEQATRWFDELVKVSLTAFDRPFSELLPLVRTFAARLGSGATPLPALWGPLPSFDAGGQAVPVRAMDSHVGSGARAPRKVKTKPHVERVESVESSDADNPLVHSFEKVHTVEEFGGGKRSTDGSDELDAHANALEEVELGHTVRTTKASMSFVTTDSTLDAGPQSLGDDSAQASFHYDEWDERRRIYRRDWCALVEADAFSSTDAEAAAREWERGIVRTRSREIARMRALFERIENERRWRGRQLEGAEVDIEAVVDRYAALMSGHTPNDALYADRRRATPSLAVTFLFDSSASTDAWVANRRVMDVAKEAIVVVAHALEHVQLGIHIAAFSSETRHHCRYVNVKPFHATWRSSLGRLFSLKPEGYTRIGPAVRHAATKLASESARRRVLLLISDAKPTDYDAYEGAHGIADVRRALREAQVSGVESFALAIDSHARAHLPQMFGSGRYAVMPNPEALAGAVGTTLARFLR